MDGWQDIVTVGEWEGINVLINNKGAFVHSPKHGQLESLKGWWYSITPTDINGDGYVDLIVGNLGENYKHHVSPQYPLKVYANDFDHTGSLDIVLSKKYKDKLVPARGKECSSQQMPFISDKFETYDKFASASLVDIYGDKELSYAYEKEAITFKSIILLNDGKGELISHNLPTAAQLFPLLGVATYDVNDDGKEDLILSGNIYETEVETPRLDAGTGTILLSDGKSGYILGACPEYCLSIPGNVKSLHLMSITQKEKYLLALKSDDTPSLYKLP
jgi:hypothetical protein